MKIGEYKIPVLINLGGLFSQAACESGDSNVAGDCVSFGATATAECTSGGQATIGSCAAGPENS